MTDFVIQPTAPPPWETGSGSWHGLTFVNGLFAAVTYGGDKVTTSVDGINWNLYSLPSSSQWNGVAYGAGMYVSVVYGSGLAASSPDGVTWTTRGLPSATGWNDVIYGGGKFVTYSASQTNRVAYSTDGVNWTARSLPVSGLYVDIAYGGGRFVIVASASLPYTMTSTDAITWTRSGDLPVPALGGASWRIAYGNGRFVAVSGSAYGASYMAWSVDAAVWEYAVIEPAGTNRNFSDIVFGNGVFIVTSSVGGTNYWARTVDGTDWAVYTTATTVRRIASDGGARFFSLQGNSSGSQVAILDLTPPTPPIFWTVLVNTSETP